MAVFENAGRHQPEQKRMSRTAPFDFAASNDTEQHEEEIYPDIMSTLQNKCLLWKKNAWIIPVGTPVERV